MKKKILIVAHRWLPRYGGLQIYAYSIAKELKKKYDISIFTSKEKNIENIVPKGTTLYGGKSINYLYNKFGLPYPIFSFSALQKLRNMVKSADVILINDRYYMSSFFAYQFAKKYKKKTILILHTPILKYNWPLSFFYNILNRTSKSIVKNSDTVIGVTRETAETVLKHYNIKRKPEFIYNPVQVNDFEIKCKKFRKFTILFVGRFVQKKGVDYLPDLAKNLKQQNIDIIAIGDGPLLSKIKEECKYFNNIKFAGKITDRKKMINYYKRAHIFLLPSKYGEAMPLVMVEAMAARLPIIATLGGTYKEIFKHDIGYLFKKWDTQNITKKIIFLKNNQKIYFLKSKNAYHLAKDFFDMKIFIKKISELIEHE